MLTYGASVAAEQEYTDGAPADTIALQAVVVTAQKRAEAVQNVPISMTVLDESALNNTHVRALSDMQQLAPNFSIATPSGAPVITIRGVGGGRNIGYDTRVGVYLDGVYIGQSQALNLPVFDIERVEVLRGPQGYLFGRNTDAGAVNITTKPPSEKFEGYYKTGFGSYGMLENYASVTGAVADNAQAKVSVGYETRDGFGTNLYNNTRIDVIERLSTRAQLSLQPTERLNIDLYADIKQNNIYGEITTSYFGLPLANGLPKPYTVNLDTQPYVHDRLSGTSLTVNYDLPSGSTLTAITGYRSTYQERMIDDDFITANLLNVHFKDNFDQTSQEIRMASSGEQSLRYVSGLYLMHENADSYSTATIGKDANMLNCINN